MIYVDEEALNILRNAIQTAGQEYKQNIAKLNSLMEEITRGDIKGAPAEELLAKYHAKEEALNQILKSIEEAEEYMGMQTKRYSDMITDVKEGMR